MKKPKSIDLFSGCGGLGTGFEKAGFDNVVSNDIWETAQETFLHNNPSGNFILGDITQAKIKKEIIKIKDFFVAILRHFLRPFLFGDVLFLLRRLHWISQDLVQPFAHLWIL